MGVNNTKRMLLKYLSIKDGLKLKPYFFDIGFELMLLKYLSIKDGLKPKKSIILRKDRGCF